MFPKCAKLIDWKQSTFMGNGNKKIGDREKNKGKRKAELKKLTKMSYFSLW